MFWAGRKAGPFYRIIEGNRRGKRNEQVLEVLIKSSIKGKKAMPPKGGQSDLEVARTVVFMCNAGGGKFEEPKAAEIVEA